MSIIAPLAHFDNYARLHRATRADLPLLGEFTLGLTSEAAAAGPDWNQLLSDRTAYVLIATECQIIVGVCVVHHAASSAEARLSWLYVQSLARGRGLGTMLVGSAIEHAQSEGAANIIVAGIEQNRHLHSLLVDVGFEKSGSAAKLYSLSVWNSRQALSYCDFSVPPHQPTKGCDNSVNGLLLAMGTLNETMLLTAQAEKVLQHEVSMELAGHGEVIALARAAARRRFSVTIHAGIGEASQPAQELSGANSMVTETEPLTPERIVGHLSRQHVPLLCLHFARLNRRALQRWYLVTGFDGYLFRLVDVAQQTSNETTLLSVTAPEMRTALSHSSEPLGLTLAQVF